jgi:hypothetical protein
MQFYLGQLIHKGCRAAFFPDILKKKKKTELNIGINE